MSLLRSVFVNSVRSPIRGVLDSFHKPKYGPQLVVNGRFYEDANWTKGTGWTIDGGVAVGTGVQASGVLTNSGTVTPGTTYLISYDLVRTLGGVSIRIGSTAGVQRTASGSYSETITAGAGTDISIIRRNNDFTGTIDNVSVREIL